MPDFLLQLLDVLRGNVIPTLVVLTAVVFVHEMGHFLVARWCRIRVDAFSIGFGRELFGFTDRRGTRWKISAIPLGGYVRFAGDENAASIPDPDALARIPPAARRGMFYFAPVWKRVAVVAAGPIANFLLAILVFAAVFTIVGRSHILPVVGAVDSGSPAERAGFQAADRILGVGNRSVDSFSELQDIVSSSADRPLTIVVERDGKVLTLTAVPERREVQDMVGRTHRIPVLGIKSAVPDFHRDDPLTALSEGVSQTGRIIKRTLVYLVQLATGREDATQLSGLIGIGQISGAVASDGGIPGLIYLAAFLSVSIGLFNLFPVPLLDGGHLLYYAIEIIRGRPLSPRLQELGFRIGFAVVIFLFILTTFNDIANRS